MDIERRADFFVVCLFYLVWMDGLKSFLIQDNKKVIENRALLNPAPTSTQLHPSLLSSIHLHPVHLSVHPALCNTLNVIRTKISHVIGQFPQI